MFVITTVLINLLTLDISRGSISSSVVRSVVDETEDTIGTFVKRTINTVGAVDNGTEGTVVHVTSSTVRILLDDLNSGNLSSIFSIIDSLGEDSLNTLLELLLQEVDLPLGTAIRAPELIEAYGYPVEIHEVITEDGYILTLHRIPHGKNESGSSGEKSVAFFMPGVHSSGTFFLVNSYEKNLPYALADDGYDIWICSPRGTSYSTKHVNASITEAQYFNYSFTQKGLYDASASINYILNSTQQEQLFYIGHSEGTTDFLVLTSERPEYNEKIQLATLLAPVSYMKHCPNPLDQLLSRIAPLLQVAVQDSGTYSLGTHTIYGDILAIIFCNDLSPVQELCYDIVGFLGGYNQQQCNNTLLPLLFTHFPEAVSIYELLHYAQLVESGEFRNYDYGSEGNLAQYGTTFPPNFNISNIVAPVALYYGLGDSITSPVDIQTLAQELPNLVRHYAVKDILFSHFDFVFAKDVMVLLNDKVIDFLKKY